MMSFPVTVGRVSFICILTVGLFLSSARGQSASPVLHGKVLDPSRASIAGATVTAVPDGGGAPVSAVSDQDGAFTLPLNSGSRYTLKIAATGFLEWTQPLNVPPAGSAEPLEAILQLPGVLESVTVTESPGYLLAAISSGTKTITPLRDVPQSITVVTQQLMRDQQMTSIGDVVRYVPGVTMHQGENNRDDVVIRGNRSSADFFVNGVRDDVQYYRDLYNLERVEALKGPNAMIFGRGGGGGVLNRVTKDAGFMPLREMSVLGGTHENKRLAADFDQPLNQTVAFRVNGVYENSDSFRNQVNLERYGIAPTLTILSGRQNRIRLNYEHFNDHRTADRGIPSFQGKPADIGISSFFGNPDDSRVRARVNLASAAVDHQFGRVSLRNNTLFGDYDKFYQNYVPGAASADGTMAALTSYNNATRRKNVFNQTDVIYSVTTGSIRHTLLGGAELGQQLTDNFRNTGYFNGTAASILVPLANPTIQTPVTFRQSATDADNHLQTRVAAAYVQDQIELSRYVQVVTGVRFDRFDLEYHNNRTNENLRRIDNLASPRAGLVVKPMATMSLYGNYSVSYLPSSGDQFSSLTTITQQVKPEKFSNYELGLKWDFARGLSLMTSLYRLNRTNTRSTDPNDPTRIVQTGSTRTNGYEIGLNGTVTRFWKVAGGYAYQDAFITSATTAARAGAQVAQVPHHTFSFWNNYQVLPKLGLGLGIVHRNDMFAAVDNTVILPGYTRADAALFFPLNERMRLQVNAENLFNKKYYVNADNNTNISPGSSRAVRLGLTARF